LVWTEASLDEDWPAPVRTEPAGDATVVPIYLKHEQVPGRYQDPTGDTESDAIPWVDIHLVGFGHNTSVVAYVPGAPNVDPTEQWIAYGVVVDDDGDGVGDRRFGLDNIPGSAADWQRHRAWVTDLHTGRTESSVLNSSDYTVAADGTVSTPMVGDTFFGASFPAAQTEARTSPSCQNNPPAWMRGLAGAQLMFGGGDTAGGGSSAGSMPALYYAWASEIVDGRVVATDYAPDAGWLHPSSKGPKPSEDEVTPPIDSLEEAVAAAGQQTSMLSGFQASDTHVPGASAWIDAEARGDGWDVAFVCGDCPAGCISRTFANYHVQRDGTVDEICQFQDVMRAPGSTKPPSDYAVPGFVPDEGNEPPPC